MRRSRLGWIAALGLATFAAGAAVGQEVRVALARLPKAVRQAADREVPGARWAEAVRETDDGEVTYRIIGTDAEGDDVEVTTTPDGRVTEVATEVEMAEVPRVVRAALRARMPSFRPESAMEIERGGKVVGYEFEGRTGRTEADVFVSADGRRVELQDD
jgi:hypothetical protein